MASERLEVVEICAGAGGQSLGLHRAGFAHKLALELDSNAATTLSHNLARLLVAEEGLSPEEAKQTAESIVKVGDVADKSLWDPYEHKGVDLLAGGVPCPPFSIAGNQLGATDERDLFAWAVHLCADVQPKALLLENVKGLSGNRFSAYRQHILELLHNAGYVGEWRLLEAHQFGVSQLRPRFVLVALQKEFAEYFHWPEPSATKAPTVGELLKDLMAENGWAPEHVEAWAAKASAIAPTIVGGSKKHGGADLGPTRAKAAWRELGVDALGVANTAPDSDTDGDHLPKLTTAMVARIQGWSGEDYYWEFQGRKTTVYRQIGNAFPPPVAEALGRAIASALRKENKRTDSVEWARPDLDPVYVLLRHHPAKAFTAQKLADLIAKTDAKKLPVPEIERRIAHIERDFHVEKTVRSNGELAYQLGEFKAFVGQQEHARHDYFAQHRGKVS
ncbi:DNA (cytosine-5-)-methyltransferase [Kitasatospora xanthocidica]|uniref:Cytosine-specific methyltransferase n=1 Tax=Kitasatospora xanthocidica TaxID=83382 RepID=A0A373A3B9_9ACTN|nr:DNA (cytosine-5-)-methyltransferase [Kitasatospora xanthocidica]RGD62244.1 DNA (cytosine-5-)-methyltransferase [Kitasatospora xanthocidica]